MKVDMGMKNADLVRDFLIPDYTPIEYHCTKCGTMLKLKQKRVLYCKRCRKGFLHPRYDFEKDSIK